MDVIHGLYAQSLPRLGAFAYLLTGNHSEAEELVQAAIVKAFSKPRKLRDVPSAEAYVRATMRTLHIDGMRRQARWRNVQHRLVPDAVVGSPADSLATRDEVGAALATLAPRVRATVALFYGDDLSVAQIAHELGVSEGTVGATLAQAHAALEEQLQEEGSREQR